MLRKIIKNIIRSKFICNKNGFFVNLLPFSTKKSWLVKDFDFFILQSTQRKYRLRIPRREGYRRNIHC